MSSNPAPRLEAMKLFPNWCLHSDNISAKIVDDIELCSLSCSREQSAAFRDAFQRRFVTPPPGPGKLARTNSDYVFWSAPEQWIVSAATDDASLDIKLAEAFASAGYATLQSDAWTTVSLRGAGIGKLFERLSALDLSHHAFPVGSAARTMFHHIAVYILRIAEDEFHFLTPRSTTQSFLKSLEIAFADVQYAFNLMKDGAKRFSFSYGAARR